ncbi:aminoacyl-tRNA hydrolase [Clostridium perfringens]|uniref:Peptidyl-tRNA hydrolase n=2 Tax=Clostridium perfringens TaxID=1502 RepID=PTH_CLOPS|nr:aminoacyl-tRNA hydrolase [Clostridium perfringens]Q0SQ66.1 RecName: Full=Peptidyl-tRNA hydrolase; Short=PTH [Clostridium perfringens SM101]ABG86883.1 peptidyl-tRNA hydrolase [Clostridium perfringens SM101]EJT5925382.1 aminoacyl-tRNA hydrolase [Clostridium perfringens]EJT5939542.1 aminoacyl-tRNA hydrolase [Clostridium perfringens]EJT6151192.1 aminoacyl-tRNA hydrolase [Clostridium perfringens]EJT6156878.1 aminoacyl-tRNA hydrolase [Clostridium perfringens]
MILIVGLGNPGKQYEKTRHNIGFDVIDYMANKYNIDVNREKFKGICGEGFIENKKVILLKPLTYMNLSGESIREFVNFYKLEDDEIIVVYDDISLDIGRLRIREKGSAGGHNGIKSIIQNLGGDKFPRVKVGVGQPKDNLVNHVLGKFSKEDREHIEKVIPVVSDAIVEIVKNDAKESMNKFNGVNIE